MSIQKFIRASMQNEDHEEGPPQSPPGEAFTDFDTEHHSMVCAGCSCLCDDISYYIKGGQVVRTLNLCEVGWKRLNTVSQEDRLPPPSPSLLSESLNRADRILRSHQPVLVLGADSADEAAIRTSFELAGTFQGISLPWAFSGVRRFYGRAIRFGWATALLDEVRDHAESVIFWRADPLETHHRHLSRYSLFARGRFTERGNLDRNLAAVASEKTVIEPLCQQYFQLPADQDVALIDGFTHHHEGKGFDHRDFPGFVRAMQGSSYVALFVDPEKVDDETLDALFEWSIKLNNEGRKRMVLLPLWAAGSNIEGFCRVSLEKNATPWGTDLSAFSNTVQSADRAWENLAEIVKSVLVIPPGIEPMHTDGLPESLRDKPRIVIDPFKQTQHRDSEVVIPTALPGLESDGIFFRADGLPFNVRGVEAITRKGYPTVDDVLANIMTEGH
jgi:formylmethanofuran dehydrogenase subunit B